MITLQEHCKKLVLSEGTLNKQQCILFSALPKKSTFYSVPWTNNPKKKLANRAYYRAEIKLVATNVYLNFWTKVSFCTVDEESSFE
jgi:hypothetical protein